MVRQTKNSKSETHLPRSPYTEIKEATLNYSASDRILQLSNPKIKKDNHLRLEFSNLDRDPTNSGVFNKAALRVNPTDRVLNLCRPKLDYKGYKFAYEYRWGGAIRPISAASKRAHVSERVALLAEPKKTFS